MSENNHFNPFDPTGLFKDMRDAGLGSWSRMMIQLVNTETYARATAVMLDAWLSNSAPFRKTLESALAQALANLNLPSRADVAGLAERLTNIELRLDDLEAKLDEARPAGRHGKAKPRAGAAENHL